MRGGEVGHPARQSVHQRGVRHDHERVCTGAGDRREGGVQFVRPAHLHDVQVQPQRVGGDGQVVQIQRVDDKGWVGQHGDTRALWHRLLEELQSL